MRKYLLTTALALCGLGSYCQKIEFVSSLCTSTEDRFKSAYGYGIDYQFKPIKDRIQFGLALHKDYCNSEFSNDIYFSGINEKISIQRTSIRLNMLFVWRSNDYFFGAIGPDISYNLLAGHGYYEYNTIYTPGFGLLAKFELKNIFTPKLSFCINFISEFTNADAYQGLAGDVYEPFAGFTLFTEVQLGLKYNFQNNKITVK